MGFSVLKSGNSDKAKKDMLRLFKKDTSFASLYN